MQPSINEPEVTKRPTFETLGRDLERLFGRARAPLEGWSVKVLAGAERGAAKRLHGASAQLERVATRLDAAGRAMESRAKGNGAASANGHEPPAHLDELCPPHLA